MGRLRFTTNQTSMLSIAVSLLSLVSAQPGHEVRAEDALGATESEWKGTLGAGLSSSSGNTDRRTLHTAVDVEKRIEEWRYSVGFHWLYADEAESGPRQLLERRAQVEGQVDFFLDETSYILVTADAATDKKAALDLRSSLGVGYGYQVVEEEDWKLSIEAGLSGVQEEFEAVDQETYLAGRFGYALERKLGEHWTFSQNGEVFPSIEEAEDVYVAVDTRLRCTLSESLYGQFQWIYDWDNTPASGAERENHRLLFSVGYSF